MKLKVKRKYRPSKFKKHFKKTYKKKNRTHRVKKHKKNQTKNNRRRSKKYLGGSTQIARDKGPKLLQESLMKEFKKISTTTTFGRKTDESANCKKLNGLVDKMHKLESSTAIMIPYIHDVKDKRIKVYNTSKFSIKNTEPIVGMVTRVDNDNEVTIDDNKLPIKIMNRAGDGFTNGKEFMFVGDDDKYKQFKKE